MADAESAWPGAARPRAEPPVGDEVRFLRASTPYVDFVMLNRLAELLVRTVPALCCALRITYPFVFVDEFQDTTRAQFSFLSAVFGNGPVATVVGDAKQRIMGWAGALPYAVGEFRPRRSPGDRNDADAPAAAGV